MKETRLDFCLTADEMERHRGSLVVHEFEERDERYRVLRLPHFDGSVTHQIERRVVAANGVSWVLVSAWRSP